MKIIIMGSKMELTPSIKALVEEKLSPLGTLLKRIDAEGAVEMRVDVGRTTRHHRHGEVFKAEANLRLPQGLLRAEAFDDDVRKAVDGVKKTLKIEIAKYKAKHAEKKRAPARKKVKK